MNLLPKTFSPAEAEQKWYAYWLANDFFAAKPNTEKIPYTVVIPPPNVTGVLHMGHMLNNTIQDVLIRRKRMQGFECCWVPGTDHASIATEAKVVALLKEKGIEKKSLTREAFLEHAWDWKEKYGGIILEQLKKLGCSADWARTRFTMEPKLTDAVIKVFVDLYNKGHIYRGIRMVNWDPAGRTALSDEEVLHKEAQSKLYYINYPLTDGSGHITIATTRPETIMADSAVAVNPNDTRYTHLVGKKCTIPLLGREIPIIADSYVSFDFGTGCLKVTPAHDINDYELGVRHRLPVIDILADDGTLNEKAVLYVGQDRFAVRKQIVKDLAAAGFLEKEEDTKSNLGYSERTGAVIEPKLSLQWFLKMEDLSKPALEAVMSDEIQLHPARFKNLYRVWMENVRDWCISRQLWWGQQIPAFYLPNGAFVVAETAEKALVLAQAENPDYTLADLKQDDDVLDTWFSSWLWPISVFDGFENPENEDIKYFYPTDDLVTAPEILFFWVARMIIAGYEYRGERPFKNVYLTGIVRDKQGRKMSKSLGNSPDPLDLIAKYGADGVRTGMLFSSPAGNDLPFDEKLCEQGRNFSNKIWNAFRLIQGWQVDDALPAANHSAVRWFEARLNASLTEIEEHFEKFRISDALLTMYKLIWDDFCAWYLEMVKPAFGQSADSFTYNATRDFFEKLMLIAHPYMPFITEEIWQNLRQRKDGDSICVAARPVAEGTQNEAMLKQAELAFEAVAQIRNLRNGMGMSPKNALSLYIKTADAAAWADWTETMSKLANLESISFAELPGANTRSFALKADTFFIPVAAPAGADAEKELAEIEKELEYTRGFLDSVNKKLANEKFTANAKPEVLERERAKLADAESKIKTLESALANLKA
ncbi:MAG: valine--tRNA ligase [Bacteroidota bacterium]